MSDYLDLSHMASGDIGAYKWTETVPPRETALFDTLRALRRHLVGLRAVNVSWDSGLFVPSDDERSHGWTIEQDHAVSPVIDDDLIDTWPWCDGGFEEWYFFSRLPHDLNLSAYCNWTGVSLADWAGLVNVPTGLDLRQQLEKAKPSAVVGMGESLFAISPDAALVADLGQALRNV
jgi:hypothetical protein